MYLKSLKIQNFRCFSEIDINFSKRITVISGNNGTGKSTVLEAAAVLIGTLTSAMDGLTNYNIKKSDVHYNFSEEGGVIVKQLQFPVEIGAKGEIDGREVKWTRILNSAKGRSGFTSAKEMVQIAREYQQRLRLGDATLKLPIISYYGTGRRWEQYREKKNETFEINSRGKIYRQS